MNREVIYIGHDNSVDVILKENSTAVDLSGVTQMSLNMGQFLVTSTNSTTQAITWNKSGYSTGETRFKLGVMSSSTHAGSSVLATGNVDASLIVYDATNTNGIVFGDIPLLIKQSATAT